MNKYSRQVELSPREITTLMRLVSSRLKWMEENEEKMEIRRSAIEGWREMLATLDKARQYRDEE